MERDRSVLLGVLGSCLMGLVMWLVPAGDVYPRETQKSCNAKGYIICSNGQCGSKYCGGSEPGRNACYPSGRCYYCDGCTGTWLPVGSSQPGQGGMVVPPGTMMPPPSQPPLSPTTPGTVAPGMTAPIMPRGIEGDEGGQPEASTGNAPKPAPKSK